MSDTIYSDPNFTKSQEWLKMSDTQRNHYRHVQRAICSYDKLMALLKPYMDGKPVGKSYTIETKLFYDYSDRQAKTHDQLTDKSCHKKLSEDQTKFVNVFPTQPISVTVRNNDRSELSVAFALAPQEITTIHNKWSVSIQMINGYGGVGVDSIESNQWIEFTKIIGSVVPILANLQE